MEKACRVCGQGFAPKQQRSTICSKSCENKSGPPCTIEACSKPRRARGLCATHYNQQHQPERHRKVVVQCGWCGGACEKAPTRGRRYDRLFCSLGCRDAWSNRPRVMAERKLARAAEGTAGRLWVAGDCRECGRGFIGAGVSARYCSPRCAKRRRNRHDERRRRMRRHNVGREPYEPIDIYRRDGWRCHLCRRPVRRDVHYLHPDAPTVDHLIPVSDGGADAPWNVRCAHRSCNTRRGVGGVVQLLLDLGHAA